MICASFYTWVLIKLIPPTGSVMKILIIALLSLLSLVLNAQEKYSTHKMDSLVQAAYTEDQSLRTQLVDIQKKANLKGYTPEILDTLVMITEAIELCDKTNTALISQIMKKGWPEGLQKESYHAIWIIIDHADIKYQKKFFLKLQVAAEKGYISKSELAVLKDRILMKTGKPQMYGTQSTYTVSTDNQMIIYLWPVKTPEELDQLRKSVGLTSINEYIKELESASDTQVIYDSTLTVKQIKRMIKDNRIIFN